MTSTPAAAHRSWALELQGPPELIDTAILTLATVIAERLPSPARDSLECLRAACEAARAAGASS